MKMYYNIEDDLIKRIIEIYGTKTYKKNEYIYKHNEPREHFFC